MSPVTLATPTQLLAAASTAVAGLLDGPPRTGRVAALLPVAIHIATGEQDLPVVCLATPDAVRLPCSLVVGSLPPAAVGERVELGGGGIVVVGMEVRPSRWWQPSKPRLRDVDDARRRLETVAPDTEDLREWTSGRAEPGPMSTDGDLSGEPVRAVLAGGAPLAALVPELLGLGPGLTPAGDDVLAGALVTLRAAAAPAADTLAAAVEAADPATRTTTLSAALLTHATRGDCVPELAGFLDALDGRADLANALARLRAIGGTSGSALAVGVRLALGEAAA